MLPLGRINEEMQKLQDWSLESGSIVKERSFSDFGSAIDFVNRVADLAEEAEHHPDIVVSFNRVRLSLTTHSEKGLTSKDFELAQKIDKL
jgi:4a-hydroxytetrahydrobiopterin dehydratase